MRALIVLSIMAFVCLTVFAIGKGVLNFRLGQVQEHSAGIEWKPIDWN